MRDTETLGSHQTVPITEHFDVLIVGAGISGHRRGLPPARSSAPDKTFVVLEALEDFGGTWHTHTYPGIRSDSDLYTFGYRFKPWVGPPIATGDEILKYMGEVIEENDLARHIRYRHKITAARWSSAEALWTVEAVRTDTGEARALHRGLPLDVPGLLPARRGLHAGLGRACPTSRAASSTRRPGPTTST